jgi:hypothetical protein
VLFQVTEVETLKETERSSETSTDFYQTTLLYSSEVTLKRTAVLKLRVHLPLQHRNDSDTIRLIAI